MPLTNAGCAMLAVMLLAGNFASGRAGTRSDRALSDEIAVNLKSHFSHELSVKRDDLVMQIEEIRPQPQNNMSWDEVQVLPSKRRPRTGLQLVRCGAFENGRLQTMFRVKLRVRTYQDIVVATEQLDRHAVVQASQLALARRETTRLQHDPFTEIHKVVGLRTRRIVRSGEALTGDMLEAQPLIRAGDPLTIHFRRGSLEVTMPGMARQDGQAGEEILVKCLETRRTFHAVVYDATAVIVNF